MGRLDGQVAIVTGVSSGSGSGIGEAVARRFAAEGAAVLLVHHFHPDEAARIVSEIEAQRGRAAVFGADVTVEGAAEEAMEQIEGAFGAATILVNSAGVNAGGIPVAKMSLDRLRRTLDADVIGPFLFARAFVRSAAKAGRGGRILNITSVHDETPQPGAADYCAARARCGT